jgi:quercetin dioxygenase-like cupin family protein
MKHTLEEKPVREVFPGFHGRFVHSDRLTLAFWDIDAGSTLPAHSHPHEQVVNMIEGDLEIVAGGVAHRLRPGDVLVIPGGVEHSGRALTACRVMDVFSPAREDYRQP